MNPNDSDSAILALERPHPSLFTYYWLSLLVIPPLFPILILPAYFRYHTMRYRFTDEGISMSWGIFFRRQIIVNYARIQDIHLESNIVERWLGLARILVQTASGNASAEMTIEGIREFEALRDFLYARMRGVRHHAPPTSAVVSEVAASSAAGLPADGSGNELAALLRETAQELRLLRIAMDTHQRRTPEEPPHV